MNIINSALRREERAIFDLRELYEQSGYRKYKMSKFEEYDLYLANKRFLPGGQVVTFTDANGRLMWCTRLKVSCLSLEYGFIIKYTFDLVMNAI